MSFLRISFFKTRKPKKFEPVPRFYDPNRETIDKLMQKYEDKDKAAVERMKFRVRNTFQAGSGSGSMFSSSYNRGARSSNMRLIIILLVMLFLIYLIFIY
ncbi:MAG: hypothetical protein ACM3PT_03885 [Deltaproteobacteria bacterium]